MYLIWSEAGVLDSEGRGERVAGRPGGKPHGVDGGWDCLLRGGPCRRLGGAALRLAVVEGVHALQLVEGRGRAEGGGGGGGGGRGEAAVVRGLARGWHCLLGRGRGRGVTQYGLWTSAGQGGGGGGGGEAGPGRGHRRGRAGHRAGRGGLLLAAGAGLLPPRLLGVGRRLLLGVVVAHELEHVLLQPRPRVLVLLAELLQDQLLGERPRHAEPQELLQDQRLVLGGAHLPLIQVTALRILKI